MIGQTLSHYRIAEKIGAGGMGEVYKAHDERLDRDVAIKVLPSGTLADEHARKRFRKEALALSKLNHPNIATVFDFDTEEGVDFIVMEYVEGASLAEKVKTGLLPEKEISELGAQIADALEEAHERGIVHRDLKPGNIAATPKGRVKVLDFGLARMLRPVSDEATTEALTQDHAVAGTLPYMSPEELRGGRADHRSDLYSFGVVLYEMATGRRPFEHTLSTALADAIIHKPPEPPSSHNRKVSPGLESIIIKGLDKDPEHRYQSAREMRVDLERLTTPVSIVVPKRKPLPAVRWLWAAVSLALVLAVLVALNVGGLRDRLTGGPSLPRIDSIAVLPLENLSGDPEQDYFADGMTEALITDLSKIGALKVISRTSSMRYRGFDKPITEIAKELNVEGIVEGSVLRVGDRVRITAQLIEAPTDQHLWAESYERDLRDILTLQGEVAREIAQEIQATLTPQEQARLVNAQPVDPKAHEAYLRGRYYWNKKTPGDLMQAIEHFRHALDTDPDFALAYADLASSFAMLGGTYGYLLPPQEAMQRAKAAANKSLEINPALSEGYASLGFVLSSYERDWSGAENAFKRAIELNPGNALTRVWFALHLSKTGRHREGLVEIRRAQDLDPLDLTVNSICGYLLFEGRQYDEAIHQLKTTLALDPNFPMTHRALGFTYLDKKMYDEAINEHEEAVALTGRRSLADLSFLGGAYAAAGKRTEAMKILLDLEERSTREYVPAYSRFHIYMMSGDLDDAFFWLERSIEEYSFFVTFLRVFPLYDAHRSDPRFQDLLRRMNFPE